MYLFKSASLILSLPIYRLLHTIEMFKKINVNMYEYKNDIRVYLIGRMSIYSDTDTQGNSELNILR